MKPFTCRTSKLRLLFFLIILVCFLTTSCSPGNQPQAPTETPTRTSTTEAAVIAAIPTATERPTATPTPAPLGSEANPIMIGFVLQPEDPTAIEAAEDIAFLIGTDTNLSIEYAIFPDFQSLSVATLNGDVHLFWLSPFEYLYLNQLGTAEAILVTNHLGVYAYGVQFLANAARGFTSYFDPETNQTTGEFLDAIQQFSGTRPCFISPDSVPGSLVPLGLLANASAPTLEPIYTHSYNATIRALFIQGICDFGVSYALIGDPRNSSDILQNLPEATTQIITIWQSEGIIPNTNLSISPEIPLNVRYQLQEAFLDLPLDPEGLSLLSSALKYEVEALKTIRDEFYNPFRTIIAPLELDLEAIALKITNE